MTRFPTLAPLLGLTALAALLFSPAPASAQDYAVTVTDLTPAPGFRTANGTGKFTLTVTGTRFTHDSFISWKGKRLPTTFQNSEHLQADVSASLVAQPGTASVTVSTPGVDTSQGKTFTITP